MSHAGGALSSDAQQSDIGQIQGALMRTVLATEIDTVAHRIRQMNDTWRCAVPALRARHVTGGMGHSGNGALAEWVIAWAGVADRRGLSQSPAARDRQAIVAEREGFEPSIGC